MLFSKIKSDESKKTKPLKTTTLALDIARETAVRTAAEQLLKGSAKAGAKCIALGTAAGAGVVVGEMAIRYTLENNPNLLGNLRRMLQIRTDLETIGDLEVAAVMKEAEEEIKKSSTASDKTTELHKAQARIQDQKKLLQEASAIIAQVITTRIPKEAKLVFIKALQKKINELTAEHEEEPTRN